VPGLTLAAVPARESPSDVLVSHVADRFGALPANARVGTGSARRRAQLWHRRPELSILGIRGNVDTRLKQLDRQDFDAIILAEAGLQRLGLAHRITQVLPSDWMLPAVGQGALGLETRESDDRTRARVRSLDDRLTRQCVLSERALLGALGGGCSAPVAAWGREEDGKLVLDAAVLSPDGSRRLHRRGSDSPENARSLGRDVADQLLALGAAELLALSR